MSFLAYLKSFITRDPIVKSVGEAETLLVRSSQGARPVSDSIVQAIGDAREAVRANQFGKDQRARFLKAYADLVKVSYDLSVRPEEVNRTSFEDTVDDSELLIRYAAECGKDLDVQAVKCVMQARTAVTNNQTNDDIKANLFTSYAAISKALGSVTAETIRSCSSLTTRQSLRTNRWVAILLTVFAAVVSLVTFAADNMSEKIKADILSGGQFAAKLRAEVPNPTIDAHEDVCTKLGDKVERGPLSVDSISSLQDLAGTTREILSRSIKLNALSGNIECSPIDTCSGSTNADDMLQIKPAISNYEAELFCKIKTFQNVRTFGDNVVNNYIAFVGGITAYALPILYAILGAYAFRLRNFADTIQKRTYHPSFADSARMITAVISGAICGLFNPARGLSLSPLATAFLVGYGVELFFRFLDSLLNSFGGKA